MDIEVGFGEFLVVIFAAIAISATIMMTVAVMRMSRDFGDVDRRITEIDRKMDEFRQTDARFNFQSEMLLVVAGNLFRTNALLLGFFRKQAEDHASAASPNQITQTYSILLAALHERNREVAQKIDFFKVLVDPTDDAIETLSQKRPDRDTIEFVGKLENALAPEARGRVRAKFNKLVDRIVGIRSARWTGLDGP